MEKVDDENLKNSNVPGAQVNQRNIEKVEAEATEGKIDPTNQNQIFHKIDNFFEKNSKYRDFLAKNNISVQDYIKQVKSYAIDGKRCIRLKYKNHGSLASQLKRVIKEGHGSIEKHPLFDDLLIAPIGLRLSTLTSYREKRVYGIEASSAIVVKCMDPKPGEIILDVCCSPGAKLMYIADRKIAGYCVSGQVEGEEPQSQVDQGGDGGGVGPDFGSVFGNDLNEDRLRICNSLVNKYGLGEYVKLLNHDAVTLTPKHIFLDQGFGEGKNLKKKNSQRKKRGHPDDEQFRTGNAPESKKKLKTQSLWEKNHQEEEEGRPKSSQMKDQTQAQNNRETVRIQGLKSAIDSSKSVKPIDKILCDVECSHDGSLKHILKFIENASNLHKKEEEEQLTKEVSGGGLEGVSSSFETKLTQIQADKTISNKERKRRIKQLKENLEKKKTKMKSYFSSYSQSKKKSTVQSSSNLPEKIEKSKKNLLL